MEYLKGSSYSHQASLYRVIPIRFISTMLTVKSFEDLQILFIKMCIDVVGLANLEAIYLFVYSSLSALLLQI